MAGIRAMKISVAMATYNGERFIREQLDSLAAQTRLPDELVVVDDCSTDQTREIVADFAGSAPFPVRAAVNPRNLGWSDNFLAAMSACDGDWIALCDQDDVWMPEKLAKIERNIVENAARQDVVLWAHSARVADEGLQPSHVVYPSIPRRRITTGRRFPVAWFLPGFSLVIRADLARRLCEFAADRGPDQTAPGIRMAHDRYIFQMARSVGAIGLLPDVLVLYRRHGATATQTFRGGNETVHASREWLARIRLAFDVGDEDSYSKHSGAARSLARILGRWARVESNPAWRARLLSTEKEYDAYAEWAETRSRLYGEPRMIRRIGALARALRQRGYAKFYGGAWRQGTRALAKDAVVTAVGAHRLRGRRDT